jgi:Spy/CpxP family protein refolding chaperone
MRTVCVALALGALLFCPKLYAQETRERLAERIQDLHLTARQDTKIADIRNEYRPKVQAAEEELVAVVKNEIEQIRNVLTPEQKAKVTEMREERQEGRADRREGRLAERLAHLQQLDLTDEEKAKFAAIREEFHPKIVKAMESLKGTLTPEQLRERAEALRAGKNHAQVIAALKLTGQQKEKVEAVGTELRTLVREELEKMRDVLSAEQKEEIQEIRQEHKDRVRDHKAYAIMHSRDLNLTANERSKLEGVRREYRPKVHAAGDKLRATVREEVEAIVAVLKG